MREFQQNSFEKSKELPDHILQEINDLTTEILLLILVDAKRPEVDGHRMAVVMAALQKAVGLMMRKYFSGRDIHLAAQSFASCLLADAITWAQIAAED